MSTKSRIGAALLAAVTLGTAAIATSGEAQARHWGWGGVGLGIAAGALIGAAAANAYAEPAYYRCRFVRQYDAYGYYIGTAKVCRY
jgi:alpha-D-ribose 1-methylphosphonate 5-phosphate C-P lyase